MERETENQFFGPNLGYVLELYENYKEDPDSVDGRTREFFESWSPPRVGTPGANGQQVAPEVDVEKAVGASKHVRHIRDFGHRAAKLDPLGSDLLPVGARRSHPRRAPGLEELPHLSVDGIGVLPVVLVELQHVAEVRPEKLVLRLSLHSDHTLT